MNQTEAWELVFAAAVARYARMALTAKSKAERQAVKDMDVALKKVSLRVHRMRARLDFARARKAGKQTRPSWATP